MDWSLEPSPIARAVEAHHGTLLDLTQSNPTAAGLHYPEQQILHALRDKRALQYEPAPLGLLSAREAVSDYYGGRVPPSHVVLTASTSEAYSWLFKLLCNPGDRILVPRPSYPLFEFLGQLESVEVAQYPLRYDAGWYVDVQALREAITAQTKAIVFVNPNNPTGSFLKEREYAFITDLCAEHRLSLIADEVFADYQLAPAPDRIASLAGRDAVLTFALSGLSKVAGLPQLKFGWIAISGPGSGEALHRLEIIADTFLSVGAPVQHAAPDLLAMRHTIQSKIGARTRRNLDQLRAYATDSPAQVLDIEGGWYATVRVPRVRTEEEWVLRLLQGHDTLVQPGFFYDFESEAFLVLSLLTKPDLFAEGAGRTILAAKGQ